MSASSRSLPVVAPAAGGLRDPCGVTLVELIIAIVVISIALTGTLVAMNRTARQSGDPMVLRQAVGVAEAYLEEILLKPYDDPDGGVCPAAEGGGRAVYDNVCDYNLLDDFGAKDQTGTAITGLGSYRVRVAVGTTATLGSLVGPTDDLLRVDVRVTHSNAVDLTLSGYRTHY